MSLPVPPDGPWKSARAPRYSIHPIPLSLFEALEAGDLELASSIAPSSLPELTPFLVSEANRGLWGRRLALVAGDAEHLPWLSRLVVYEPERDLEMETSHIKRPEVVLVGRIGFHGKPDEHGMVEVGYEIDPQQRRSGHAKAAMRIMVDVARLIPGVNVLRASVVPEYWISRRVVESEGLRKVGTEVSSRHGLQDVFEIDVSN
ncbi:acetyltransferase gnat family protein [Hyaloscypha finlandica]|nr:acetyltransferase gnat family protein [Hyaloscypha finlandica]